MLVFHYCYEMHLNPSFSCFISHIGVFFGIFLGPVLGVVLFNTVVFVLVIRVLLKHSSRKMKGASNTKKTKGTFKALISIISIMSMFGLQWLFGALTIAKASLVFQWLFVIFSTLQGLFLFLFFVAFGKETRDEWFNVLSFGRRKRRMTTSQTNRSRGKQSATKPTNPKHNRSLLMAPSSIVSDAQHLVSVADPSCVEMSELSPCDKVQATTRDTDDTKFVIINDNADLTDYIGDSQSENEKIGKVDLTEGTDHDTSNLLEEERSEELDLQVPLYILQGRCMHSRLPSQSKSKEDKTTKEASVVTPKVTAKSAAKEIPPPAMDSQVPPHIAERRSRHLHKPPHVVPKQSPQTVVDAPVPPHILEGRLLQRYTPASSFIIPIQNQNS